MEAVPTLAYEVLHTVKCGSQLQQGYRCKCFYQADISDRFISAMPCYICLFQALDDRMVQPTIELRKIRSVKSLSRGRKDRKPLPRAFQIFTEDDHSFVLKVTS